MFGRVAAAMLLLAAPAAAQPDAGDVSLEVNLLEFIGGGTPLSPAEREEAAAIVADGARIDPARWRRTMAQAGQTWALIERSGARDRARLRQTLRLASQAQSPSGPFATLTAREGEIIRTHDPAVVWDAAHRRLITSVAVQRMAEADRQAAPIFGVSATADAHALAAQISAAYPRMDDGMQALMSQAEATLPFALTELNASPPAARQRFIATYRAQILQGPTPADQNMRLAQVLAGLGARGASGQGGGGVGVAQSMEQQRLMGNAMLGASRSFSPSCNVYTGTAQANPGFCHP